jgi:hypothetical protein
VIKAMSEHLPATAKERARVVTRAAVIERIEARLAGSLDDAALAAWAFDRFYAEELGEEQYEAGAETAIANTIDALMFDDDPGFRLNEEELRAMIAQLGKV